MRKTSPSRCHWLLSFLFLFALTANAAFAANGCSPYSTYGGNNGKTWFNEYYFGPATNHYLELFSKNASVTQSNPDVWQGWYVGVYSSKGAEYYSLDNSSTNACTVGGGRTYITYSNRALSLNYNDAMVVVFDGYPTLSSTREIDAFVYSNASPPTPYKGDPAANFYTPTCPDLKSRLDAQASATVGRTVYRGQNILILSNFGNKDNARLPDGTGNWDETSLTGSGTSFTQCVTNDPVDLVKTFTAPPAITTPTSSGTVAAGSVVTFTVTAQNRTAGALSGVKVSDPLPAGLTLTGTPTASAGASVSCSGTPTTCVLTAPALLTAGTSASMSFQAVVSPASAGTTIQNTAIQTAGTDLSPPPTADAFITVSMPVAGVASFNACHNFAQSGCSAAGGRLYTLLAGVAFSTDIVALKDDGTVHTGYVGQGGAAKTVRVDLVDAASGNAVVATQNVTFPASDVTGRVVVNWPALNDAYRQLQVRVAETGGVTSLSSDRFAVRPSALSIATSASAAAESASATPVLKAGIPFTVSASTNPVAGYAGTATLDTSKLATANVRMGNLHSAASATALTLQANTAAANNATYDEVGYFYAQPGAFRDDSFTAVDRGSPVNCDPASTCDCISSTAGNAYLSDQLVGSTGRYGCSIGNRTTVSFARFIPHHFAVLPTPVFTPGHEACGFTYMDQPFALAAGIEARNSFGGRTENYHGAFATGQVAVQLENADDGDAIPAARLNRTDAGAWSGGRYAVSANRFARPASTAAADRPGPYDQLAIGVSVVDELALPPEQRPQLINRNMNSATTGCTADTPGSSNGTCTAVNLLAAPAHMRFGRLRLSHAHGSELLALPVPMATEFWTAAGHWITNTLDNCTNIGAASVALQNRVPATFTGAINATTAGNFASGQGTIRLSAPNPPPTRSSSVMVCVDLGPDTASATLGVVAPACTATSAGMPWLQGRWSETNFDDDPAARATFGVRRSGPIIYRREVY